MSVMWSETVGLISDIAWSEIKIIGFVLGLVLAHCGSILVLVLPVLQVWCCVVQAQEIKHSRTTPSKEVNRTRSQMLRFLLVSFTE